MDILKLKHLNLAEHERRLIEIAVSEERAACARLAETISGDFERDTGGRTVSATRSGIAAAIRARSNISQ